MKYEQQGKADELDNLDDRTELDMPDRWKLDDAVLRMIGVNDKDKREELLDKLYAHVRQHFEWTRQKEEKAIRNKKVAKRRGPASPSMLAAEIIEQVKRECPHIVRSWDVDFMNAHPTYDTYDLPAEGDPELVDDLIHSNTLRFPQGRRKALNVEARTSEQAALLMELARAGIRGLVRVPHDRGAASELRERFAEWFEKRRRILQELIAERTADPEMQERICRALEPLLPAA